MGERAKGEGMRKEEGTEVRKNGQGEGQGCETSLPKSPVGILHPGCPWDTPAQSHCSCGGRTEEQKTKPKPNSEQPEKRAQGTLSQGRRHAGEMGSASGSPGHPRALSAQGTAETPSSRKRPRHRQGHIPDPAGTPRRPTPTCPDRSSRNLMGKRGERREEGGGEKRKGHKTRRKRYRHRP